MTTALQIVPDTSALPVFSGGSDNFETAQRIAKALAASTLVPEQYRGAQGVANVLVAMDMASRIGCSPLMAMQSLDVIHGRPGWRASFLIATVNASGKWSPIRFEVRGEDAHAKEYRCRAWSTDKETGERCDGPWIDWRMVDAEGWASKKGSKWQSMPDLMFRYRAAAFWTRLYAPELSLGMHTSDEERDIGPRVASRAMLTETITADGEVVTPTQSLEAAILGTPAPMAFPPGELTSGVPKLVRMARAITTSTAIPIQSMAPDESLRARW